MGLAGIDIWDQNNSTGPQAAQLATSVVPGSAVASLTQAQLAPVAQQAVRLLASTGLTSCQLAALGHVTYQISNLPAGYLGLTGLGTELVQLDASAAGHGWYTGIGLGGAGGQYDLLTVVTHELEHVLGQDDLAPSYAANNLMTQTLSPGMRRLPADLLVYGAAANPSGVSPSIIAAAAAPMSADADAALFLAGNEPVVEATTAVYDLATQRTGGQEQLLDGLARSLSGDTLVPDERVLDASATETSPPLGYDDFQDLTADNQAPLTTPDGAAVVAQCLDWLGLL